MKKSLKFLVISLAMMAVFSFCFEGNLKTQYLSQEDLPPYCGEGIMQV